MASSAPTHDGRISHYRILYPLGSGGMGEVYAALDETLQRRVALKAIRVEHRLDEGAQARFLREARILSQLDHPHVCRAYDYIRGEDHDWLVLELIDGDSLRDILKKGLDPSSRLGIAEQIASVLVVTHAAGIVHRDLKPGNVMITRAGAVKVLDFGLARADEGRTIGDAAIAHAALESISGAEAEVTRTAAAVAVSGAAGADPSYYTRLHSLTGTLAYMSPEQARGEPATTASDMFAFGLLLQEIFTGRRAYPEGVEPMALLERAQHARLDPPEGVRSDIAELVRALTSLAPSQRPTAVESAARLRWIHDKPKRRLRAAVALAVVLAIVAAVVKYTVDLRRERTAAVLAREDADRRRGQAENLIGFMVGDLRTKLAKAGRLELLEDVGGKAMTYFASVPPGSLSGEELSRHVQTIYQIGQVRQAQGNLKGAVDSYRESLALAEQLASRDPSRADWQLRLASAHFYLGDALRLQGDLDNAMMHFVAYRGIATRLVERDPSNPAWQLELSYAHGGVAAIDEARGDLDAARQGLERALGIKQGLVARDPKSATRQQDLATARNRLGVVLARLGQSDAALQHYLADVEIRDALVARDPRNQPIKRDLYVALSYVSAAYEDRGDLPKALEYARRSLDVAGAMAAGDSRNADWQRDLAVAEIRLASTLRWTGSVDDANARYTHARGILQPIVDAAPTNVARRRDLAVSQLGLGWIALSRGSQAAAAAASDAVERILAPADGAKRDPDTPQLAGDGRLLGAAAAERAGDGVRARQLREQALAVASPSGSRIANTRTLATRARALIALHRLDEARPIVMDLVSRGYRHPSLITDWRAHGRATPR